MYFSNCWFRFQCSMKTLLVRSITVNIIPTCLVMRCRLFRPTFDFKCIITPPELHADKSRHDVHCDGLPSSRKFRMCASCFSFFNEWKAARKPGETHTEQADTCYFFILGFLKLCWRPWRGHKRVVCNQEAWSDIFSTYRPARISTLNVLSLSSLWHWVNLYQHFKICVN